MTLLRIVLLSLALLGTLLVAASLVGAMLAQIRDWYYPEPDDEWLQPGHPARQPLVTVRHEHGREVAVRADRAHMWNDRHEGTS